MSSADLLHRLAQQLDVGVVREGEVELHRRPVAAEIGDVGELAERHDVELAVLVAQLQIERTREALDRALDLAAVDILADAEGILGEEEDARHDVAHQRLAAERHGEAEHRGAGDQRRDVDAELGQHQQAADDQDDGASHGPQQRHQGAQPRRRDLPSSSASPAAVGRRQRVGGDVAIHAVLQEPPERVDRHHAERRELGAAIVRQPFLRRHRAQHLHHQSVGDQDDDVEPGDQAQAVGHHVARHRQLRHDVARDPVHQRLEQQQRDQHRFDRARGRAPQVLLSVSAA